MHPRRYAGIHHDAELEMLQTDIMRFMAIIALCLLAIFAMVRSVSDASQSAPTSEHRTIPEQQQELKPGLEPELEPEPQLKPQVKPEPIVHRNPQVTPIPAFTPVTAPKPVAEPPPAEQPHPEPEGFTLRFLNDATFVSLLQSGSIQLQIQRNNTAWHWHKGGFTTGSISGNFYQLQQATVPLTLRQQFTPLAPSAGSQWLVSLPTTTRSQIEQIMQGQRGGELLITADGSVSIK